ncbi:hypothetical protein [Carboxylicivirga marina]|uniref:hypothetical protein n=1 Tax=Carboxylicivirga marina TaxID=2800988 RepID=UPI002597E736|nr:hypothetical protein [uncultured Carboxylicivirga sp.]
MKTFLPYFFRKIGIALFMLSILFSFIKSFDEHLLFPRNIINATTQETTDTTSENSYYVFTETQHQHIQKLIFWLALSGLLIYSFSKEKVEDEFLAKLRANALLIAFLASWIFSGAMMLIKGATEVKILAFLQIQMLIYVIVYAYTKKIKYAG